MTQRLPGGERKKQLVDEARRHIASERATGLTSLTCARAVDVADAASFRLVPCAEAIVDASDLVGLAHLRKAAPTGGEVGVQASDAHQHTH